MPFRDAVEALIREYGELFVGMEYFGARSESSLETCLNLVRESDVVIVLVGARYGSLSKDGKSYTHREVEAAKAAGIPVFAFVQATPTAVDAAEAKRRADFVRWLGEYYTWARFDDRVELVTAVAAALRRFETRVSRPQDGDAWAELLERAARAATFDCVAVTAHNVDRIYAVDLVAPDYETRIGSPDVVPGGSGANTVAGLGRLGLRVGAAGMVGDDPDGEYLRAALRADNVEALLAPTDRVTAATGTTITFTDPGGRRSIFVNPGANERYARASRAKSYRDDLHDAVEGARIFHCSSFTRAPERELQESLVRRLPQDALLSLTPGALYCKLGLDRLAPLLERTNVLFLYEQQLDALLEHNYGSTASLRHKVERLYAWKAERRCHEPMAVVIKDAAGGSATAPHQLHAAVGRERLEASEPTQAKIGPEVQIRDSTGAGDAAAAGLLWSLLRAQPLNYAVDLAYVVSRSASREMGGRAGLPTLAQLRRRWTQWVGSPHRV